MRASDLMVPYPTVTLSTPAIEAARILADAEDDPTLAHLVDEAAADVFIRELGDRTVRELLPPQPHELPVVSPQATALEIAALMARTRSPLVAVVDGVFEGAVTLHGLLDRVLAA